VNLTAALLAYAVPAALITMLPGPDTAVVLTTRSERVARPPYERHWESVRAC